ncbi:MAG: molybdenum ABC transporter ATP-binding protein [Gammaproteobacteria bacterium]
MTLLARFGFNAGGFRLDAAFELPADRVTVVFGASGSGKTTLLRCLAGLERARGALSLAGEVWLDDRRGVFVPPHLRRVGMVFQHAQLFPHLDVRGNLRYAAARSGAGPDETAGVVELLGIAALLARNVDGLSGGERQRVAIARAVLSRPRMLLLDEPLSALDTASKRDILPYLERLNRTLAIPMLYVTHHLDEVLTLGDHMLLLDAGNVVATGPINDLLASLDLPLAARDDAATILDGEVIDHDREHHLTTLRVARQRLRIPLVSVPAGQIVRVKVQARDVSLCLDRPDRTSILNVLPARVSAVQAAGSAPAQRLVRLEVDDSIAVLARISAFSAHQLALHPGMRLYVQIKSVALA